MDPDITSALIGAAATLIVGIISLPGIKKFFIKKEKSDHYIKNPNRLNSIKGTWKGYTTQEYSINGNNVQLY